MHSVIQKIDRGKFSQMKYFESRHRPYNASHKALQGLVKWIFHMVKVRMRHLGEQPSYIILNHCTIQFSTRVKLYSNSKYIIEWCYNTKFRHYFTGKPQLNWNANGINISIESIFYWCLYRHLCILPERFGKKDLWITNLISMYHKKM